MTGLQDRDRRELAARIVRVRAYRRDHARLV